MTSVLVEENGPENAIDLTEWDKTIKEYVKHDPTIEIISGLSTGTISVSSKNQKTNGQDITPGYIAPALAPTVTVLPEKKREQPIRKPTFHSCCNHQHQPQKEEAVVLASAEDFSQASDPTNPFGYSQPGKYKGKICNAKMEWEEPSVHKLPVDVSNLQHPRIRSFGSQVAILVADDNNLSSSWGTVYGYVTLNAGRSWNGPIRISPPSVKIPPSAVTFSCNPNIAFDNRGDVYVAYESQSGISLQKSSRPYVTWTEPVIVHSASPRHFTTPSIVFGPPPASFPDKSIKQVMYIGVVPLTSSSQNPTENQYYVYRSLDKGLTFELQGQFPVVSFNGHNKIVGIPGPATIWTSAMLAIDTCSSCSVRGRIYAVWCDAGNSDQTINPTVCLRYSDDGGKSFSGLIQVNPEAPFPNSALFPSVAVSPHTGQVQVLYYSSHDTLTKKWLDVWFAVADGHTLSSNHSKAFCKQTKIYGPVFPNLPAIPTYMGVIPTDLDASLPGRTVAVWVGNVKTEDKFGLVYHVFSQVLSQDVESDKQLIWNPCFPFKFPI